MTDTTSGSKESTNAESTDKAAGTFNFESALEDLDFDVQEAEGRVEVRLISDSVIGVVHLDAVDAQHLADQLVSEAMAAEYGDDNENAVPPVDEEHYDD